MSVTVDDPAEAQPEPIEIREHYTPTGKRLEVLATPELSAITDGMLLEVAAAWISDGQLVLPDGTRYRLGRHDVERCWTLLHRIG